VIRFHLRQFSWCGAAHSEELYHAPTLFSPQARGTRHVHHRRLRGFRPRSALVDPTRDFAKVAYPSMRKFGYKDTLAAVPLPRRTLGILIRPRDHGDLRQHDRDQYRQALCGRNFSGHRGDGASVSRRRVDDLARSAGRSAGERSSWRRGWRRSGTVWPVVVLFSS